MSQPTDSKQANTRKPFRPFFVAAHARENIDFNLNGLKNCAPNSLEHKKYLSWLAKTKLDIDYARQRAEKLLADLAAEQTYLEIRARSSPELFAAVFNPKATINNYFNAKRNEDDEQENEDNQKN
jgi:hypothetical protein